MSENGPGPKVEALTGLWSDSRLNDVAPRGYRGWNNRLFFHRYLIMSCLSAFMAFVLIATWLSNRIRQSLLTEIAKSSVGIVEDNIKAALQELRNGQQLSDEASQKLSNLLQTLKVGRSILDIKIWDGNGRVLFSSDATQLGQIPPPTPQLADALKGNVAFQLDDRDHVESASERRHGRPLLEVYFPIRSSDNSRIIAAGELYLDGTSTVAELAAVRWHIWILAGLVNLALCAVTVGIVWRDGNVIKGQTRKIERTRETELRLVAQSSELARRVREAQRRNVELSDQLLRHIGADLHDGPAQLLSAALLRLGEITVPGALNVASLRHRNLELLSSAHRMTADALTELRQIAKGLILPQLDGRDAEEVVRLAVAGHENRTHTGVKLELSLQERDLPLPIKTCLFRCIQEGLNNAFRHAGARDQFVGVITDQDKIVLTIKDAGQGLAPSALSGRGDALGIAGLRNRVESLGGHFKIISSPGAGTTIVVELPLVGQS